MGSVYLARATGLAGFERHVVLKMLDVVRGDEDDSVAMFLDEARVVGRMHHQHIAPAYELDRDDDDRYFLVMDYVHGQTAKAVWTRAHDAGFTLPLSFTLTTVIAAASALQYAHSLKARDGRPLRIVHRDVSLSNVMLGYDGAIKLIDFGIAKAAQRASSTRAGRMKGKISYLAPEHIAGSSTDHRADLFALGIVLYELATMSRSFRRGSDLETLERIRRGDVVPPSTLVENFPPDLERIILTALRVDPAQRFQHADTMRCELEEFARDRELVLGDAAIIAVMEQLFEQRDEPWLEHSDDTAPLATDAVPEPNEDAATVPVTVPAELKMAAPIRRATPRFVDAGLAQIHDAPTAPLQIRHFGELRVEAPKFYPIGTVKEHAIELPTPSRSLSWSWLVVIALLVAAVITLVYVRTVAPAPSTYVLPPIPVPARPQVTPIEVAPPPPPAAPATVRLRVTTSPADATVLLDGRWLGHTPYDELVPASPGSHAIKIRRHGYVPQKLDVDLGSDVTRNIVLRPSE